MTMAMTPVLTAEVAEALAEGRPVVALESTIVTHGMPWPRNLETAQMVEETIREGRCGSRDHRGSGGPVVRGA